MALKREKRWWHLSLFGLELKPIYGVIAGLILWFAFDRSSMTSAIGTLLFIPSVVALIADLVINNKKRGEVPGDSPKHDADATPNSPKHDADARLNLILIPLIIVVWIIVMLFMGWFYWFQWRPAEIKKECYAKLRQNENATVGNAKVLFDLCLHSKGL